MAEVEDMEVMILAVMVDTSMAVVCCGPAPLSPLEPVCLTPCDCFNIL